MGGALYSALNGEGINLVYDSSAKYATYNATTNTLTLKDLSNYHTLAHEMIHAYQDRNVSESYRKNNVANLEVEAYMAKYMLQVRENSGVKGTSESELIQKIIDLEELLDGNCNILEDKRTDFYETYDQTIDAYRERHKQELGSYPTFSKNEEDMNFDRLKELSKDC